MRQREKVGLCGFQWYVMNADEEIRSTHIAPFIMNTYRLLADCCWLAACLVYSTACALHVYNTFYLVAVALLPHLPARLPTVCAPLFATSGAHDVDGKYYLLFLAAPPNTKIHKENDFLSAF